MENIPIENLLSLKVKCERRYERNEANFKPPLVLSGEEKKEKRTLQYFILLVVP